jgi:hypothetical protein
MIRVNFRAFGPREQENIRAIDNNVRNMEKYVGHFHAALTLFDYCLSSRQNLDLRKNTDEGHLLVSWRRVAVRDGVMTIFHFGKAFAGLRACRRLCPISWEKVDGAKLKDAGKLFDAHFAGHGNLRHAVAHSAELTDSPQSYDKNSFTGSHEGAGFSIDHSVGAMVEDFLNGRTYTTTHEGKFVCYDISNETLQKLVEVSRLVYDALGPLLIRLPTYTPAPRPRPDSPA